MSTRWLILADDLTGAADAAAAFARRGHDTEVGWTATPSAIAIQAVDLDTRPLTATEAAARHVQAVRRALAPGTSLFKKIDSTLRGQPAAEMAAISATLRELGRASWGLLAPANPAMRRTTRDGRVLVDGMPLEQTDTWRREHTRPDADLVALVQSAGLRAIKLPLEALRGDGSALRAALAAAAEPAAGTMLVCDAETDQDLARVVAELPPSGAPGFFAGTAGLANALARATPPRTRAPVTLAASARGTLVAVGTLAQVSRESARRLAARAGTVMFPIDASRSGRGEALATRIAETLCRGETAVALLDSPGQGRPDAAHARHLSDVLAPALHQAGALIVTGGETAAALLARCKVHGIRLLDEVEPGIALGMTQGAIGIPIITKPGAFGDADSLARCLDALDRLRRP